MEQEMKIVYTYSMHNVSWSEGGGNSVEQIGYYIIAKQLIEKAATTQARVPWKDSHGSWTTEPQTQ